MKGNRKHQRIRMAPSQLRTSDSDNWVQINWQTGTNWNYSCVGQTHKSRVLVAIQQTIFRQHAEAETMFQILDVLILEMEARHTVNQLYCEQICTSLLQLRGSHQLSSVDVDNGTWWARKKQARISQYRNWVPRITKKSNKKLTISVLGNCKSAWL